jgi:hypothetical protein
VTREHFSPTWPTDKRALIAAHLAAWVNNNDHRSIVLAAGERAAAKPQEAARPKRQRKPSLARAIAEAEKAGKLVTAATVTRDGVTLTLGEATETDTDRELADFEARHKRAE